LTNNNVDVGDDVRRVYHIRCFEVSRSLVEQDVYFGESELHNKLSLFALDEAQLIHKLALLGVTLDMLRFPADVDYPI